MKRFRPIKIVWKKLDKAWGYAIPEKWTIVIDPRLDDKTMMDILIHETDHVLFPFMDEVPIDLAGRTSADVLYRAGFRRIIKGEE